jgi:feruloyl esterase
MRRQLRSSRRVQALYSASVLALLAAGPAAGQDRKQACEALASGGPTTGRVVEATLVAAGEVSSMMGQRGPGTVPDHCLVRGLINERTGIDGKPYAISYELRLPLQWNGKFFFQGGGGTDGILRPAVGVLPGAPTTNGLMRGYAVVSTDAGHRDEPGPLGSYLFGLDPQARADKGYNSIPTVNDAARALIERFYSSTPSRSYFVGCSNGGRQAMLATQRYPQLFDGVIAGAPAYRVPLAAIDAIHQTQLFARVAPQGADGKPDIGSAFTAEEMKIVAGAVLETCDVADGARDGLVQNVAQCKFDPHTLACKPGQNSQCLPEAKASVLDTMFSGARNSKGEVIYSTWPFDPGIAGAGWAAWRLGTPQSSPPNARNATLIPGSLAYVFNAPPDKPTDLVAYALNYNFDTDPQKVWKSADGFEAGMEFEAATSTNLDAYKARGGKILFHHGVADPIFSALDTIAYVEQLGQKYGSEADSFARLFLIPGMAHCGGGPATNQFDGLSALEAWVEMGIAPASIEATAPNASEVPWPGRTRPLCPWPKVATYKGSGDLERADSFECR